MNRRRKSFPYHIVIVSVCFLMVFIALGFGSSPRKLYVTAVPKALNLDYGPYSINDSFRYITSAILNLFFGALIAKLGPRKLIAVGFSSLILSMLFYSFARTLPVIYFAGALLGIGATLTGTTMVSYVISRWCPERKGTMTGLVLCANGIGGATATQILSPIIHRSLFSYRQAYQLSALIMACAAVLIIALFRNPPENTPSSRTTHDKKTLPAHKEENVLRHALKKWYFYAVVLCIFATGMILQSIVNTDAHHMKHTGLDAGYAASILSIQWIALSLSKFFTGWLYDKHGLKKAILICDGAALLSLLLLVAMTDSAPGKILAAVYSFASALALPLETIMIPLITSEFFGQRGYAQMLGIVGAINTAGFALGPPVTSFVFDALGSYIPIYIVYFFLMIFIILIFLLALNAAGKDRSSSPAL